MPEDKPLSPQRSRSLAALQRNGGNISAAARELGLARSTIRYHCQAAGYKPFVGGLVEAKVEKAPLPTKGKVRRYILTSAQNNTRIHERVWKNLLALAEHYKAEVLVGTFSYNKNAYGPLALKRGATATREKEAWYDQRIEPYIRDVHLELGQGLLWCGEMNILPTAADPLAGLETYSGRKSGIFPHAKHAMRSIAGMQGESPKFNYTTGTVTQQNYLQKRAGFVASHHHNYGGLLVEINSDGNWWVRQLQAGPQGRIHDLDLLVEDGRVTSGHQIEAITWGDLHATALDPSVVALALGKEGMLAVLRPRYQFIHDLLEGVSVNHHTWRDPHEQFKKYLRGYDEVSNELKKTAEVLRSFSRVRTQSVIVSSNHDHWFMRWLREHDYRSDPRNALLFLEAQTQVYRALMEEESFNLTEWLMQKFACPGGDKFLNVDESFKICNGRIECGQHGHLGPDGRRGTARNLSKIGRRSNTAHTHSAGIWDGLFVAGTSTVLNMGYNAGPSSWSHSHIVTYPNGRRAIITMFAGKWRG